MGNKTHWGSNTVVKDKEYTEHWDLILNRKVTLSKKINKEKEIILGGEIQKLKWRQLDIESRPYIIGEIIEIAILGLWNEKKINKEKIEKILKAIELKDKKILIDGGTGAILLFTNPEIYKLFEKTRI
jgi:hypothetical protein